MKDKEYQHKNTYAEKILIAVSYILRLLILVEAATAAWNKNLLLVVLSLGVLILTFLPSFFERNYKINLPIEFEFLVVMFIFFSLFLGEQQGFYLKIWWWDAFLHAISSLLLAFVGFLIPYILYTGQKIKTKPKFIALFSFCFALAIGAVWEIVEFTLDSTLGWHMQKSGLVDTMWDLIVDSTTAFVISVSGYFYLKRKTLTGFFDLFLTRFLEKNPQLFRRSKKRI